MLVLALDTATPSVVVGVVEIGQREGSGETSTMARADRAVPSGNRHAENLGVLTREVLTQAGIGMTELSAVVVGLGPGPFTGLRVGIVTAAAFADALGIRAHGACTHDAIARNAIATDRIATDAMATDAAGGFAVVTDARRRECYWASYDASGTRIGGPYVERPADVVVRRDWVAGGSVIGDPAFSAVLGTDIRPAGPGAVGLVLAAPGLLHSAASAPLEALYLRRPDAMPPAGRKPVTTR